MTTLAAAPPAIPYDPDSGPLSAESSGFDPLFRAESAANGEMAKSFCAVRKALDEKAETAMEFRAKEAKYIIIILLDE